MKSPLPHLHESVFAAGLPPAPSANAVLCAYENAQAHDLSNIAIRDSWIAICPDFRDQLREKYADLLAHSEIERNQYASH